MYMNTKKTLTLLIEKKNSLRHENNYTYAKILDTFGRNDRYVMQAGALHTLLRFQLRRVSVHKTR